MQRAVLSIALFCFALAGVAVFVFGTRDSGERGASASPVEPAAPDEAGSGARDAVAMQEADDLATIEVPAGDIGTREAASSERERELAEGRWVEGRVVFPPDTPLDERVRVVANGRAFEHGPAHAVDVGRDGRFRVAFASKTRTARIELEARWLYLPSTVKVDLDAGEPVVLEPRLGGVIQGVVVPPDGVEPEALIGVEVTLWGRRQVDGEAWSTPILREVTVEQDLAYEFLALPPDARFDLEVDPGTLMPAEIEDILVEPGRDLVHDLKPLVGASLAGVVVDEDGAPVEGCTVRADVSGETGWSDAHHRMVRTEADGSFRLTGVAPGPVELNISASGYEDRVDPLPRLERGEAREGVRITLGRGRTIAGVVRWPDGSPAEGASITPELAGDPWANVDDVRADATGAFEITGLTDGTYRVNARGVKKEKVTVTSRLTGKERQRTVSTAMHAAALDVTVGTRDLVLTLSEGAALAGFVVDDAGAPLDEFRVEYGRRIDDGLSVYTRYDRRKTFKDADGVFELTGLEEGKVSLRVSARGYLMKREVVLSVPLEGTLEPIVLHRAGALSGVVVDASGAPAAGATIEVQCADHFEDVDVGDFQTWVGGGSMMFGAAVDDDGSFALEGVPPTAITMRATRAGDMPSEELAFTLEPGGVRENLVLALRAGATITGVVLGPDGQTAKRRLVELYAYASDDDLSVQSEADGTFEVTGLAPGTYELIAQPSPTEVDALGFAGVAGAAETLASTAVIELTAAGAHVVLRPAEERPVRAHGTTLVNGEPDAVELYFYHLELDRGVGVNADADGEYVALLPAPGPYSVTVQPSFDDAASSSVDVEIVGPDVARQDFSISIGSISGVVRGPDGPIAGVPVRGYLDLDEHGEDGDGWGFATTDGQGRYELLGLAPGSWVVMSGGPSLRGYGDARERTLFLAETRIEGVILGQEEARTGVDLELRAAGVIAGTVHHADGSPAAGARIFVRDERGEMVGGYSFEEARANGAFEVTGLLPGRYHVAAARGDDVSESETELVVREGEVSRVELMIVGGTILRVRTTDLAGTLRDAYVTVHTEDGADVSMWQDWQSDGWWGALGEHHYGPLPPGRYTVTADWEGSKKVTEQVTLDGQPAVDVTLALP